MANNNYPFKSVLLVLVEVLKEQAEEYAGTYEGLNPWQALNAIRAEAETWNIPLSEIGLDGYDIDALLNEKKSAA